MLLFCSYSRVYDYFIEFINFFCKFFVYQCLLNFDFDNGKCLSCFVGGCGVMGYDVDVISVCGVFYLSIFYYFLYCGKNVVCVYNEVSKIGMCVCFFNNLL